MKRQTLITLCGLLLCAIFSPAQPSGTAIQQVSEKPAAARACEELYVRTDRDFYLSGEIIWYKAHLRDALLLPATEHNLLYLELWNSEEAVLQQQVQAPGASANGSFYLPLSLESGVYVLRAYTTSTRSFPHSHFEKKITIINPFNPQKKPAPIDEKYHSALLPEGGRLVQDLPARVGVKITDEKGRPVNYSGVVLRNNMDTIASFAAHKFGLGSFGFTPDTAAGYTVLIRTGDSSFQVPMPEIHRHGAVLQVQDEMERYHLRVFRKTASDLRGGFAVVHKGDRPAFHAPLQFESHTASLSIAKSQLGEGISQLTILDDNLNPVGERLLFKKPDELLPLDIGSYQQQYASREKVKVSLQSNPGADISMAVYRLDSLNSKPDGNILNWLWLRNHLKGKVDSASYYFGPTTAARSQAMENLLLTHGWRGFTAQEALDSQTVKPVVGLHHLLVKVTDKSTGQPAANVQLYLSVPGKQFQFYTSETNSQGVARIVADRLYGSRDILLVAAPHEEGNYNYEILSPYSPYKPELSPSGAYIEKNLQKTLQELSLNMQVQNVYAGDMRNQFREQPWDGVSFYGRPEETYLLDEYTRFPTMEEVLREYVTEVQVRRQDGGFWLRMYNEVQQRFYFNEPLRLIDGIPLYSSDKLMEFDPLRVEKLELVEQRYVLGRSTADGIVSFTTYEGDTDPEEIIPQALVTRYQGLEKERIFYSPQYENDSATHLPDFRTLLYWNPEIALDADGSAQLEFYTGNRSGNYLVVIEGIDPNGRTGVSYLQFEVRANEGS